MKLVVFGLSISSSWGNGHATTYRALLRGFAAAGHEVTFYECDVPWYAGSHRDLPQPDFLRLVLYGSWDSVRRDALDECRDADATIVGSYVVGGAAVIDDLLTAGIDPLFFYDIDTPVTVSALRAGTCTYLRADQIPEFARYLSFTGGPLLGSVVRDEFGAAAASPLYCCVDPVSHRRSAVDPAFQAELAYMGTYAPDRQPVIDRFFLEVARRLPDRRFLLAGPQYPADLPWPANVELIPHLPPARHPAFYSSARWQLNATRADMVSAGWSPSVRLFEAGAAGAAVLSDAWPGIDSFFVPGRELLLPGSTDEVVQILTSTPDDERLALGEALRERVRAEHTAERRAAELEGYLSRAMDALAPGTTTPHSPVG